MASASPTITRIPSGLYREGQPGPQYVGQTVIRMDEYRQAIKGAPRTTASEDVAARSQPDSTAWQTAALAKICKLLELEEGWDSYSGRPIKRETGMFALQILQTIMQPNIPAPTIVPSSTGGIQLEWHSATADLEIHIGAPYDCELWFENQVSGETIEDNLVDQFGLLARPLATFALS